jgi:hypothetical protein
MGFFICLKIKVSLHLIKIVKMNTVQGIQFENDANGNQQYIRIDLEKYGNHLKPFLKKIGLLEENESFDGDWENAVSSDDFLKSAIENIKKLPWKK